MWRIKRIFISICIFSLINWFLPLQYVGDLEYLFSILSSIIFCLSFHFIFQRYDSVGELFLTYNNESKKFIVKTAEALTVGFLLLPMFIYFLIRFDILIDKEITKNATAINACVIERVVKSSRKSYSDRYYYTVSYTFENHCYKKEMLIPEELLIPEDSIYVNIEISRKSPNLARLKPKNY